MAEGIKIKRIEVRVLLGTEMETALRMAEALSFKEKANVFFQLNDRVVEIQSYREDAAEVEEPEKTQKALVWQVARTKVYETKAYTASFQHPRVRSQGGAYRVNVVDDNIGAQLTIECRPDSLPINNDCKNIAEAYDLCQADYEKRFLNNAS